MNSFPLNFTNSKQTLGTSTTDTIKTVNLFSPEQPNEIEIELDMAEGNLSKSSEWPMTTLNHQGPQQLPLQNESQPKLVEAQDHLSPYFSNDSKIRVSGADDKSGDCTKSQLSNVNSVQSIEVADQSSGSTKIAAGHRKLREIGMYDAHLVEKEFESLIHQLNLKRQHDAETFQQFCKSLRIKTEAIIDSLDRKFKTRYAVVDEKLNKAGNELMAEVEKGVQMEGDLNVLKTRVAGILQHLQMLTGISGDSSKLQNSSPTKSQNV